MNDAEKCNVSFSINKKAKHGRIPRKKDFSVKIRVSF